MSNMPFHWEPQATAGALVDELLSSFQHDSVAIMEFAGAVRSQTGTQLLDWVDELALPSNSELAERLSAAGFVCSDPMNRTLWEHPGALFPRVQLHAFRQRQLTIRVESVADFMVAQQSRTLLSSSGASKAMAETHAIEGGVTATIRRVLVASEGDVDFVALERNAGYETREDSCNAVRHHAEAFRLRQRIFDDERIGFSLAMSLAQNAMADLGQARACELFFAAEREYWQRRNRAARVQKARHDALGLGWANHDHHTYRCSRSHFLRLIEFFETLGMQRRERFYAGRDAGWGAQVLEHPQTGIVVFADVDMSPDELLSDFTHEPLPPRAELGTVGLWCRLHGEAFLQAGMHHLECQFDFDAVRDQLAAEGVVTMAPFTDLPALRQAFTVGEVWPVSESRIRSLCQEGLITSAQADQFRQHGAVGSHLEILQRHDGYRGFNQTGISDIIRETDPRRLTELLSR